MNDPPYPIYPHEGAVHRALTSHTCGYLYYHLSIKLSSDGKTGLPRAPTPAPTGPAPTPAMEAALVAAKRAAAACCLAICSRRRWAIPEPAGISLPMMTFSLRPTRWSV